MNKRGFTLIELIATITILGIVASISIYAINGGFTRAKEKSEDIFVKTLEDAINIYIGSSDAKELSFNTTKVCTIGKRFGSSDIYKNSTAVDFKKIIESDYTPLTAAEMINPANKEKCNLNASVSIYHDDDFVYYYFVNKPELDCLNVDSYITNLPYNCLNEISGLDPSKYPCGYMEQLQEDNIITVIPERCSDEGVNQ